MSFLFGSSFNKEKSIRTAEKYAQQNQFDAAIQEYQKILTHEPDDLAVMNSLGNLLARAGRVREAVEYLVYVADCHVFNGAPTPATAVYKRILKIDSKNTDVLLKLAELLVGEKQPAEARQHFLTAAGVFKLNRQSREAANVLARIVELDPDNPTFLFELIDTLDIQGFRLQIPDLALQSGKRLLRKGAGAEAVRMFQKALDFVPDSRAALQGLVEAHIKQNDHAAAFTALSRQLERAPNDKELLAMLGELLLSGGKLDLAESVLLRLFKQDQSSFEPLMEVAKGLVERNEFARAMTILDQCIPILLSKGQKKRATGLLKNILKRDPDNFEAAKRLAAIYTQVKEKRNLAASLNTLIHIAGRKNKSDEAIQALKTLVVIEPRSGDLKSPGRREATSSYAPGFESGAALMETLRNFEVKIDTPSGDVTEKLTPLWERSIKESEIDNSVDVFESILERHPEFRAAKIKLLEDLVAREPNSVPARLSLKQAYVADGRRESAAAQCLELARLYEAEGAGEEGKKLLVEAYELNSATVQGVRQPTIQMPSVIVAPATAAAEGMSRLGDLLNLRQFKKQLEREVRRVLRRKSFEPLTLIRIAVDGFAEYAALHGTLNQDACLENVAGTLEEVLRRPGDVLGYAGGGDFIAMLPETFFDGAELVAEKLRAAVEALAIPHAGLPGQRVTVSLGLTTTIPQQKASPGTMIAAADQSLAQAQAAGGNRVCVFQSPN